MRMVIVANADYIHTDRIHVTTKLPNKLVNKDVDGKKDYFYPTSSLKALCIYSYNTHMRSTLPSFCKLQKSMMKL